MDYFLDKIDKIWRDLDKYDKYNPSHKTLKQTLSNFEPMTNQHVLSRINSMATKSCENDPIPTSIFKKAASHIIDEIRAIINISLCKGFFACKWKNVITCSFIKKVGLDLSLKNYRLVNNLPFLSKVVEKCMLEQLNTHCNHHDLMLGYQSAYRTDYSCGTALVKLTSDIPNAMEYQKAIALVVLDLSAAFDTVDHGILFDILNHRFGVDGSVLEWYYSYLQGRSMTVYYNDSKTKPKQLQGSIPQGSCGGPVLYLIYTSTIQENIPPTIDLHAFVDNHGLKHLFKIGDIILEHNAISDLESCMFDGDIWMN